MTLYMLDTDMSSYIIRERPASVKNKFQQVSMHQLCISSITYAELLYGVERSSSQKTNRFHVDDFASRLYIKPWDEAAAEHYAQIRCYLEKNGTPIGGMDMQIAAHARSLNAVVVTNNMRHFERVPDLKIENWVNQ